MWCCGSINNNINSHRTKNYRACTAEELTEILKTLTNISSIVYCHRNATPDIKNQLISSGIIFIPVTRLLISEEERNAADERVSGTTPRRSDAA